MGALRLDLIRRYLRPHRRQVLQGAAALVVVNLLSVSIPLLVRRVIDDLQDGFALGDVLAQAALIVALASVMGAVRLYSRMLVFGVGRQVEADLKQQIFDHLLLQEPGWVQTTGSGELISRATSDVENVRRLMGFAVLSLTNTVLAYALTLPAMLAIDPWLSLAAVGLYPVMLVVVRLFGGRMMRQQRRQQEALASLSDLIQEDLSGISAIKIYGQESTEQAAFAGRNRTYRDAALNLARTRSTDDRRPGRPDPVCRAAGFPHRPARLHPQYLPDRPGEPRAGGGAAAAQAADRLARAAPGTSPARPRGGAGPRPDRALSRGAQAGTG